jgi:hypothetical protein
MKIHFVPQQKQLVSIITINWLLLFKEMITVYSENHPKP